MPSRHCWTLARQTLDELSTDTVVRRTAFQIWMWYQFGHFLIVAWKVTNLVVHYGQQFTAHWCSEVLGTAAPNTLSILSAESIRHNVSRSQCSSLCHRGTRTCIFNASTFITSYLCAETQLHFFACFLQLYPALIFVVIIENAIRLLKGKSLPRVNDSIASLSSGIFQDCFRWASFLLLILLIVH